MRDIPILTYHKVSDQKEFGITTVSIDQFDTQMKYLKVMGYNSVCLKDLKREFTLPQKPVIITFDDGYESVYHNAAPLLKKYDFKAVIFVVTHYVGQLSLWEAVSFQQKFRHLSEDQLIELRNEGHEIASHGRMHKYLPLLRKNTLYDEIIGSKSYLERLLGESIKSFCYPYGKYSNKIVNLIENAGYRYATTNLRIYKKNNTNPFLLTRRSIYSTDSLKTFKSKVTSPARYSISYFSELLIQKGALASIAVNLFSNLKSHF